MLKFLSSMLCTSNTHPFSLGNFTCHWELTRIRVSSVDVDDVAPPIAKLSDAKRHASLLSSFLSKNSFYFGVNDIISFQKLVGNFDMTFANLARRHQRSLDSYFKSS